MSNYNYGANNNDFFGGFSDLLDRLENGIGSRIDPDKRRIIIEKLTSVLNYEPKIGIFGKTSSGKSSLCNALFGTEICPISDIEACTRNPQEILLNMSGRGLKLLDVPGVGENRERDKEYAKLYKKLLPELDLVLWVLKADDRAYTPDENFYENIIKPCIDKGKPFLFVLNQCDKIEPFREWDEHSNEPGETQKDNISKKIDRISRYFNVNPSKIIPVSANEKYNLVTLVENMVLALPSDKRITLLKNTKRENWSDASVSMAKRAWYEVVADTILGIVDKAGDVIISVVDSIFSHINPFRWWKR